MKIFDPKRHLPVGWDWEDLRALLRWGHSVSAMSMFAFLPRYFRARDALYYHNVAADGTWVRVLNPERTIAPFWELMAGMPYFGMWCFFALMAIQLWRHYQYHTRDAMPIYLMRRLPDRWELPRRCWTVPVLACAVEIALFAALTAVCLAIWWFCTPVPCRPV